MPQTWSFPIDATATIENSRAVINDMAEALRTLHSGSSAPTETVAYMLWLDTTNKQLKQRNGADSSWIVVADLFHADGTTATGNFGHQRAKHKTHASSGAALTLDFNDGTCHHVTLDDDCTFTFSNPQPGEVYTVILKQDATGSRDVTWPANVEWVGGSGPGLTEAGSATDIVRLIYNSVDDAYQEVGRWENLS